MGFIRPDGKLNIGSGLLSFVVLQTLLHSFNVGPIFLKPCRENRSAPSGTTTKSQASNAARFKGPRFGPTSTNATSALKSLPAIEIALAKELITRNDSSSP